MELDCGDYRKSEQCKEDDVFLMEHIIRHNAIAIHGSSTIEDNPLTSKGGLWTHASLIAHSCLPNTARGFIRDLLVVHATKDIKAGKQLFSSYAQVDDEYETFINVMHSVHKTQCNCVLCVAEQATTPAQRALRQELGKLTADFVNAHNQLDNKKLDKRAGTARVDS